MVSHFIVSMDVEKRIKIDTEQRVGTNITWPHVRLLLCGLKHICFVIIIVQ